MRALLKRSWGRSTHHCMKQPPGSIKGLTGVELELPLQPFIPWYLSVPRNSNSSKKGAFSPLPSGPTSLLSCPTWSLHQLIAPSISQFLPDSRYDSPLPNIPQLLQLRFHRPTGSWPLENSFLQPSLPFSFQEKLWDFIIIIIVQLICDGKAHLQASPTPQFPEPAPNPQEQCFHFAIFSQVSLLMIVCPC